MPAPPGVAVGISSSQSEVMDNESCGVSHKDEEGLLSMPAPPVGGANGGCTMAGGAATLGVPPSGAVRGSAFSCSTSSGAAPGGTLVGTVAAAGGAGGAAPPCGVAAARLGP